MVDRLFTICDLSAHDSASFDEAGNDAILVKFSQMCDWLLIWANDHLQKKLNCKFQLSAIADQQFHCLDTPIRSIATVSTTSQWWIYLADVTFCNICFFLISEKCIFHWVTSLSTSFRSENHRKLFFIYHSEWVLARLLRAFHNVENLRDWIPQMSIFYTLKKSSPEARLHVRVRGECFAPFLNFQTSAKI